MTILFFIIKAYIVLLLFRYVTTQQELTFNPVGKTIAMFTDPAFKRFKVSKQQSDKFIPMLIIMGVILAALLYMLFNRANPVVAIIATSMNFLLFFMMFFIVSVLLGSIVNRPMMGAYVTFFFRLGVPWVKLTRTFIPISSGKIIYPTVVVIFLVYLCAAFILTILIQVFTAGVQLVDPINAVMLSLRTGLLGIADLLFYLCWIIVARALMSWVSPDVRNPIVQLVYTVTEPVLAPFRRIIPVIGLLDLSAFVAILVFSMGASIFQRIILTVFN